MTVEGFSSSWLAAVSPLLSSDLPPVGELSVVRMGGRQHDEDLNVHFV